MKIDFDASYKEVSRLLRDSPATNSVRKSNAFAETLGSISPDAPKILISDRKQGEPANPALTPNTSLDDRMGSLKAPAPQQIPFDFKPLSMQIEDPFPGGQEENSVKTPTLLEVKRIEIPELPLPKTAVSPREEKMNVVRELLNGAGDKHGVDPALGMAVIKTESNFDSKAVSQDGHASKGLFQLLDSTGQDLMGRLGMSGSYDPFDPTMNVELGVSYLRYLHDIFSAPTNLSSTRSTKAAANSASLEKLAVAAFNAGEGRVASAQARAERAGKDPTTYTDVSPYLPLSTQQYVERVMSSKKLF